MLRNFIRDRGTQVTLGTFVATFVYAVLALGSVSHGDRGDFVPHLSITVALLLVLVDLGVLIYFIHHVASSIQLPEVMASIANDLSSAIDAELADGDRARGRDREAGLSEAELLARIDEAGADVPRPTSGYLQFVAYSALVDIAAGADSVIRAAPSPWSLRRRGAPAGPRLAGRLRARGHPGAGTIACDGCASHAVPGPDVRHRPACRDRHPRTVTRGERYVHRPHVHRLAGGRAVQDLLAVESAPGAPRRPRVTCA